jgi:transposase-like protein
MDKIAFITERFNQLSNRQQDLIIEEIERLMTSTRTDVKEKQSAHHSKIGPACPDCSSTNFRRNGHQQGQQIYLCKDCGRQYRPTSVSFIGWLKKPELLPVYIRHMLSGHSLRKCAKLTEISLQTSFDWRHKILTALGKFNMEANFSGIVESDDFYLPYSEKGNAYLERKPRKRGKSKNLKKKQGINDDQVAIIGTVDRQGNQSFQVAARGRISKKDIERVLQGKIANDSVLCTDSHRSYTSFGKSNEFKHVKIKASEGQIIKGIYHVQHVNQKISDIRKFLATFNGVSTKYLQNYMNWYAVNERIMNKTVPVIAAIDLAVRSLNAWQEYGIIRSGTFYI